MNVINELIEEQYRNYYVSNDFDDSYGGNNDIDNNIGKQCTATGDGYGGNNDINNNIG